MGLTSEIPLPVSPFTRFPYRALREPHGIRFERLRDTHGVNGLVYGAGAIAIALAAAGYFYFFATHPDANSSLGWSFHAITIGSGTLILWAIERRYWFTVRLRACTLARRGDGILELRYDWQNGTHRTHRLRTPANFLFLLQHDTERTPSGQNVSAEGPNRTEDFDDVVTFTLIMRGKRVATRIPLLPGHWLNVLPSMSLYFKAFDCEQNRASAMEAALPLVDAIISQLEIPVVFQVSGGRVVLRRLEPGEPISAR